MPRLSLSLLGPFKATLDGDPITEFESDKVRVLLAYLAAEADRPHRRETLAALLWPERTDKAAFANLRNALANLRKAIGDRRAGDSAGPPSLLIARETIQFNRESDQVVDVLEFRSLLQVDQEIQPSDQELEQAIALYRGSFLEGLTIRGSPAFDDWSLIVRERYQREMLAALQRLAERCEERREYGRACDYAWRQVELAPWQEKSHRQLMRLLALGGQRGAALAQYEVCCRQLEEELNVEPTPQTTRLYERIRAGEELLPAGALLAHNLPASLTPFVGRETDLTEIADRLADPACRLLSLVGPGGIGKTRLAVEAAREQLDRFADGVFFVALAGAQSTEDIVFAVARAVGFSFYRGGDPRQQLLDHLRHKRMLLILDNIEHLLAEHQLTCPEPGRGNGAELATELLRAAPDLQIVITSRARLSVRGEHLLSVGGLCYPETPSEDMPEATHWSAVQLFLNAAHEVRPGWAPTMDDRMHVARICCLVYGMPLAILLAAAWMGMLTPAEIAAELVRTLDFLAADWRDVPPRQRSIRAVFDHSWNLLSERERNVLRGLSVFRGGFTRQAAQQVTGASLHDLIALVDRSLLHRDAPSRGGRYGLHELLRQYAAEKLEGSSAAPSVRDRHCAYYISVLEQFAAETKGAYRDVALASMDLELENARAAWDWSVAGNPEGVLDRRHVERMDRAMEGLARFFNWRCRYLQGETVFRAAAQHLSVREEPPLAARMRVLAKVLAWQGLFVRELGRPGDSLHPLRQALVLLDVPELADEDTRAERAFVLLGIGWSVFLRDRAEASRCFSQGLALYRELGDQWWAAETLRGLRETSAAGGDFQAGSGYARESIALYRALGNRWGTVRSGWVLAVNCALQGQVEEAERVARESFAIEQELNQDARSGNGLKPLGMVLNWIGKYTEAHSALERSIEWFTGQASLRSQLAEAGARLARVKIHLGEYAGASVQAQKALALAQQIDHRYLVALARLALGHLSLVDAAHAKALEQIDDSLAAFREAGRRHQVREAMVSLAYAARGVGDGERARRSLYECLEPGDGKGSIWPVLYALPAAALLRLDQGDAERAVELYALASRYPVVANSRWFEDVAGRQIAAAAAALPTDVVVAAQERGRARDLWATVGELLDEL